MKIRSLLISNSFSYSRNTFNCDNLKFVKIQKQSFAFGKKKSLYSKKETRNKSDEFNQENTIDITESDKKIEKEMKFELKNLEKSSPGGPSSSPATPTPISTTSPNLTQSSGPNKVNPSETNEEINSKNDNLNFDAFKKRNKEINSKIQNKEEPNKKPKSNENVVDEKTLAKLEEIIKENENNNANNRDIFKLFKDKISQIDEEELITDNTSEDNGSNIETESNVLVHRPLKNFVWGLGEKTKQKKFKFQNGELPTTEAVVNYLEVNNMKDIIVVPTHKLGLLHLKETSILCSGFTAKHIYKCAKDMVVELKKLNIPNLPFTPTVFGRRDEEWLIIEIGEIHIHFFVESFRKEDDLLERWLNPTPKDFIEWQKRVDNLYYGKKKL